MFFRVLRLWRYLFKYKYRFFGMVFIGIFYGLVNTSLAGIAGFMIKLIDPEVPTDNALVLIPQVVTGNAAFKYLLSLWPALVSKYTLFYTCLGLFLVLVICLSLAIFLMNYLSQWVSLRVTMDLRNMLSRHMLTLDFSYFIKSRSGDLITRVNGDLDSVTIILSVMAIILSRPIALIICLVYIFYLNWQLTLWGLIGVPLATIAMKKVSKKIRWTSMASRRKNANVMDAMIRFLSGIGTVKAFGCEEFELENYNKHNEDLFDISAKNMRAACSERPITSLTSKFGIFLVLLIGGNMVLGGELQIDNVVSFLAALSLMYAPAKELNGANVNFQNNVSGAERVFEILDTEASIAEGEKELDGFKDSIVFQEVNFAYVEDEPVVKDFSLTIKKGETVALVGASGSGKSTIINLVLRLFEIDSGAIFIDGIDTRELTFKSLRDQFALVGQSPFLFNSTIAENIAYGRTDISMEEIKAAAKAANIHEEIMNLPGGYQYMVEERGDDFSGGQKQRLSIARAICKNSPILLLDEATSALDSVNEREVQASIERMMQGRTSLVVAHRLSTIKDADKIVMLQGGRIIGCGRHNELIKNCAEYANLVVLQGLH